MKITTVILLLLVLAAVLTSGADTDKRESICLPILMYHHIGEGGDPASTVTAEVFEFHMSEIANAGYTAVFLSDVIAWADGDGTLPPKPICIVFDDGYLSNYTSAFPIIKKYGMKAVISVIGHSVGASSYKTTGSTITPHFSYLQALEMYRSGLIEFASHSYDMHMSPELETGILRQCSVRLPYESAESFALAFISDASLMSSAMICGGLPPPSAYAYPHGVWDALSEDLLRRLGYRVTMISDNGVNVIIRGDRDSLYLLRRYTVTASTDVTELLRSVSRFHVK